MNCTGCGAIVPDGATACPACGRPAVMPPPPSTSSRLTTPIRKVASSTIGATRSVVSDVKQTGKAAMGEARLAVREVSTLTRQARKTGKSALGEAKLAAHDVGDLTRQAVHGVGKGLEDLGKTLQRNKKEK